MKHFIIFALFFISGINTLSAQDNYTEEEKKVQVEKAKQQLEKFKNRTVLTKGSKEYESCYNKLKAIYVKMLNSESHQEELYQHKTFTKQLNQKIDYQLYREEDLFYSWIEQNINSTEFRNVEAAKEQWRRLNQASKKTITDNPEYYKYMTELITNYVNSAELIGEATIAATKEQMSCKK